MRTRQSHVDVGVSGTRCSSTTACLCASTRPMPFPLPAHPSSAFLRCLYSPTWHVQGPSPLNKSCLLSPHNPSFNHATLSTNPHPALWVSPSYNHSTWLSAQQSQLHPGAVVPPMGQ